MDTHNEQALELTGGGHVTIKEDESDVEPDAEYYTTNCCGKEVCRIKKRTCKGWCKKYFWEGQVLNKEPEAEDPSAPWHERFARRHRRLLALMGPSMLFHFFWWSKLIILNQFYLYATRWYMALVMIIGGLMAGMTSQGGGSVAFPTMTIGFNLRPSIARDFGLQVQSCGMGCATVAILLMGVKLEWNCIIFGNLGGIIGAMVGFHWIDPFISTPQKKLSFGAIWFSYAFALFLLNWQKKRVTYTSIPNMNWWKVLVLFVTGLVGGVCTSFAGNGLDICVFSMMTLLFHISEKVATPTSVVMMATVSMMCWWWRIYIMDGVEVETNEFITCCAGVVTIFAPLGAVLGSHQHRLVLASYVYFLNTFALVMALATVDMTGPLIGLTVGIIVGAFIFFYLIMFIGNKMAMKIENKRLQKEFTVAVNGCKEEEDAGETCNNNSFKIE